MKMSKNKSRETTFFLITNMSEREEREKESRTKRKRKIIFKLMSLVFMR
jgi:hypothetical protein